MLAFWVVTPCRLVGRYQSFYGEAYCLPLQPWYALKMKTVYSSETLESTYMSTRRYKPEEHRHVHRLENLKSQIIYGMCSPDVGQTKFSNKNTKTICNERTALAFMELYTNDKYWLWLSVLPVFSLISHSTLKRAGFMRWQLRVCFLYKYKNNSQLDILFKAFKYVIFINQHGCKCKHKRFILSLLHLHH
jgi:hypothetical protein